MYIYSLSRSLDLLLARVNICEMISAHYCSWLMLLSHARRASKTTPGINSCAVVVDLARLIVYVVSHMYVYARRLETLLPGDDKC